MQTNLKKIFLALFLFASVSACIRKPTEEEIEKNLTNAMNKFLNENVRVDSSKSKFEVVDVIFFEDKNYYQCEFKVHLVRPPAKDTTGVMTASISKDFERVKRKS